MNTSPTQFSADAARVRTASPGSAVSWGAVFAGAAAAAAISLIMVVLGVGLGFAAVSPWDYAGISAATFGLATVLWLTFTQLVAAGLGGYLTGRLRVRWPETHVDEVFFRDTAHGLLAWAVASLATAALFTSTLGSLAGAGVRAGASAVGAGVMVAGSVESQTELDFTQASAGLLSYWADALLRVQASQGSAGTGNVANQPLALNPAVVPNAVSAAEVTRIIVNADQVGALSRDDLSYLGQIVTQRTGLDQATAERRVNEIYGRYQAGRQQLEKQAKEVTDRARESATYASLWLFVSLLIGAFFASLLATLGGRQRDQ